MEGRFYRLESGATWISSWRRALVGLRIVEDGRMERVIESRWKVMKGE